MCSEGGGGLSGSCIIYAILLSRDERGKRRQSSACEAIDSRRLSLPPNELRPHASEEAEASKAGDKLTAVFYAKSTAMAAK